jgi:hypothetical protein
VWYSHAVRAAVCGLVGCILFGLTGCGGKGGELSDAEKNLQALAVLWGRYISAHRGQSPPSEAEFKKFIRSTGQADLKGLGFDPNDLDRLFTSPRDNQPYGLAYKVPGTVPGPDGSMPMVIWEKTGVKGKRMVANSLGKIEEIDEAEFANRSSRLPKGK